MLHKQKLLISLPSFPPTAHGPNTKLCRQMYFSCVALCVVCLGCFLHRAVLSEYACIPAPLAQLQPLLCESLLPFGQDANENHVGLECLSSDTPQEKSFRLTSFVPDLFTLNINPLKAGFHLNSIYIYIYISL
jgi:hypothetical protein